MRSRERLLNECGVRVTRLKLEYDATHGGVAAHDAELAVHEGI